VTLGGRYIDRYERRNGQEKSRGEPCSTTGPTSTRWNAPTTASICTGRGCARARTSRIGAALRDSTGYL